MKSVIIITARYGSTRLPGKPLAMIAGKTMLQRVYDIAAAAGKEVDAEVIIATEDERITDYVAKNIPGAQCLITDPECATGTDRARDTITKLDEKPDFVVNLQGDAPLTPPWFVKAVLDAYIQDPTVELVTPVTQMTWEQLDKLRESKKTTPFSGTTAVLDSNNNAYWFSKNIIPAIRKEDKLREEGGLSPVYRHIGLYGYSTETLEKYVTLEQSRYEKLEGLEQLRWLENGGKIRAVIVDYKGRPSMSGVDTAEDVERATKLIEEYGEF